MKLPHDSEEFVFVWLPVIVFAAVLIGFLHALVKHIH